VREVGHVKTTFKKFDDDTAANYSNKCGFRTRKKRVVTFEKVGLGSSQRTGPRKESVALNRIENAKTLANKKNALRQDGSGVEVRRN
jgi:hypothetical protein